MILLHIIRGLVFGGVHLQADPLDGLYRVLIGEVLHVDHLNGLFAAADHHVDGGAQLSLRPCLRVLGEDFPLRGLVVGLHGDPDYFKIVCDRLVPPDLVQLTAH